jgi:hypothetical protein
MPSLFETVAEGKEVEQGGVLTIAQPMDLETVRVSLKAAYEDVIDSLLVLADEHQVTDEESEKRAVEMAGQAKTFFKRMEEERKRIIQEPGEFVAGVNKICKPWKESIDKIVKNLKGKVASFQWKKELARRERERKAREEHEKLQRKIAAEAKKKKVEAPAPPPAPPVEKKQTVTRTESGATAHIRTEWKMVETVNFAEVPDEYKALNMKQVNAAIKAGIHNIPGLKIEEVATPVLRA